MYQPTWPKQKASDNTEFVKTSGTVDHPFATCLMTNFMGLKYELAPRLRKLVGPCSRTYYSPCVGHPNNNKLRLPIIKIFITGISSLCFRSKLIVPNILLNKINKKNCGFTKQN